MERTVCKYDRCMETTLCKMKMVCLHNDHKPRNQLCVSLLHPIFSNRPSVHKYSAYYSKVYRRKKSYCFYSLIVGFSYETSCASRIYPRPISHSVMLHSLQPSPINGLYYDKIYSYGSSRG